MKDIILKVDNLSKDFEIKSSRLFGKSKTLKAVDKVSFEVFKGETLGIIGESGSGKSTLGRTIIKLLDPSGGDIIYKGKRINDLEGEALKKLRKEIQIIFQDPYSSLDSRKTTGYLIEEPMLIHKTHNKASRREIAKNLLEEVGLDVNHYNRYPHEFSGGQRQRINVARTLTLNPELIICDEPVSALDVSVQAQVLNLFKSLQKKHNLTYIFISHDLSVVKYISDRIAIMYLGKIVEIGNNEKIYETPKHPYTLALFSAIPPESPFEEKEKIVLKGDIPNPLELPLGCPLVGRCPHEMSICSKEYPELIDVSENHKVACFLYYNNRREENE